MKLRTIAIDDEPLAIKLLTDYITKTPFLELTGTFDNPLDAIEYLHQETVDLILVDIQMPDLTGIEFVRTLEIQPKIIFTTAYSQYALEGFRVDAVDYLLKPFDYAEFLVAAQKAHDRIAISKPNPGTITNKEFLFVKSGYKQLKIALDQVLYFEGLKDYVKIWVKGNPSPILTLMTLKSLEEELPANRFMRVNRSFIVALPHIEEVERNLITINNNQITVSEQHKEKFLEYVQNNSL